MQLRVDGRVCRVLIDTGSTDTIICAAFCAQWCPRRVDVTTISGGSLRCRGVSSVEVETPTGRRAVLEALVVDQRPLGADMVLGMSGISALGGVTVLSPDEARFCAAGSRAPLVVNAPDFTVRFDFETRRWTVAWRWDNGQTPECLSNSIAEYAVPRAAREEYNAELDAWIAKGWLVPYDEREHGPPKGLVPLLAVQQRNKAKVRPVMDFRELNGFVTAHTADSDVCADMLRRWRRHGANVAIVDLRKAYLQLHVDQRLWPFQTVVVRGQRYCLTRLGFGLNVSPQVMKSVVRTVLEQDSNIERAVLPYVDDLLVNEHITSAERVIEHFAKYGLECKPPERAAAGARLLGLRVQPECGELRWSRDNAVGGPPARVTRRTVFSWCGRLVAHLPVCGWLRPAVAWVKRRVNDVTIGWDDVVEDSSLSEQMDAISTRLAADDPARGVWCVEGERAVVWTDASSLAAGVVVELPDGGAIEDACWLRKDESAHINMAELDAIIRGVNLAVAWNMRVIELRTDSATVHRWVDDALTGRARLRTKAHGEMLIRRRVDTIRQLVAELNLSLSVMLVRSADNRADPLTRVPKAWLSGVAESTEGAADGSEAAAAAGPAAVAGAADSAGAAAAAGSVAVGPAGGAGAAAAAGPADSAGAAAAAGAVAVAGAANGAGAADGVEEAVAEGPAAVGESAAERGVRAVAVDEVHVSAGHPGVRRTLYFARRCIGPAVTRAQARAAVERCDVCRAIDPAPVRWRHGTLDVPETWRRLAIDVTHFGGQSYLTIVDCGPSRFCLWRLLRRADSASVAQKLEEVFYERGSPVEILCDNDTAFRSRHFASFAARWNVTLRFRAAHVPSGNGIVERNHRTVKVIAARKQCSIAEAVHLYNVAPRDGREADDSPASRVYRYAVRDCVQFESDESAAPDCELEAFTAPAPSAGETELSVGDAVWVRQRGTRCTEPSKRGTVTGIISRQVVEVEGIPRHVKDLRCCVDQAPPCIEDSDVDADLPLYVDVPAPTTLAQVDASPSEPRVNVSLSQPPVLRGETPCVLVTQPSVGQSSVDVTQASVPVLRRSQRVRRPPKRLYYDHDGQGGV